jgi:hypothetical protein
MSHPDIKDKLFLTKITSKYNLYKIPKKKKSFDQICKPSEYELQLPQQFVPTFINPKTPYKSILVYHRIGAGKTCTAVRIAENFKKERKIIIVLPASLKGNFRAELRSLCAGNIYLTASERVTLSKLHPSDKAYKEIIEKSDKIIDLYYKIYSYNKFIEYAKEDKISLRNSLLIIDEIQNMISEDGTYYNELNKLIESSPKDLRIVLLSATPMFNKPSEIGLTINLLRPPKLFPIGADFDKKFITIKKTSNGDITVPQNLDLFKEMIKGYVSYFKGAPSYVFPEMKIKYVNCIMSTFQYASYKAVIRNETNETKITKSKLLNVNNLPNNFFIGTRYVSNIVFPNKKVGEAGFKSFTKKKIQNNLEKYSIKFHKIMLKIQYSSGKVFIYSNFKEYGGLKSFIKVLEAFNYKSYADFGEGPKRFAVWSGDEDLSYKEEIKGVYNMKSNLNGSRLKIILGSSSIKEGVSFVGVRQVHILDPYWNMPRLEQVIGRASRFCSHKDLTISERNVKVFIYLSTSPDGSETVDEYIKKLSMQKNKLISEFELAIKETAIDCELNLNANTDDTISYKCDK